MEAQVCKCEIEIQAKIGSLRKKKKEKKNGSYTIETIKEAIPDLLQIISFTIFIKAENFYTIDHVLSSVDSAMTY